MLLGHFETYSLIVLKRYLHIPPKRVFLYVIHVFFPIASYFTIGYQLSY